MELRWSYGQSVILEKDASPDPVWSYGESWLVYEYEAAAGGLSIPVAMYHYQHNLGR